MKMKIAKLNETKVANIVEKIKSTVELPDGKKNHRYVADEFKQLFLAVIIDKDHKAAKIKIKNGEKFVTHENIAEGFEKMADFILKEGGVSSAEERAAILDRIEMKADMLEWAKDATEEALWQYANSGKYAKLFSNKELVLQFTNDPKVEGVPFFRIKKLKRLGKVTVADI